MMQKRLKIIVSKEQNLSTAFFNKIIDSDISKSLKNNVNAYYLRKKGSQTKLLRLLNKQSGGNCNPDSNKIYYENKEYIIGDEIGRGGVSVSYYLCDIDAKQKYVIKKFNNKIKVDILLDNIIEFDIYIVKIYPTIANYWTYLFPQEKNNKFIVSKLCKGSLNDVGKNDLTDDEKLDLLTKGYNKLKVIYEHKCPFVHGDIKLENMLYDKNGEVYLHDFDGVFVYDKVSMLHVTDNPFHREQLCTASMCHPFILWYQMVLAGDDDSAINDDNLLQILIENKDLAEGMWNARINSLSGNGQIKETIMQMYNGLTFKQYVIKSLENLTETNCKEWIRINLALCDIYSYYMSIKLSSPKSEILSTHIFQFIWFSCTKLIKLQQFTQFGAGKPKKLIKLSKKKTYYYTMKGGMDIQTQTSIRYVKLQRNGRTFKVAVVSELKDEGKTFYYKINDDKTDFVVFDDITENEKKQCNK